MKLHSLIQKYWYSDNGKVNNVTLGYNHIIQVMKFNHVKADIQGLKKILDLPEFERVLALILKARGFHLFSKAAAFSPNFIGWK